MAKLADVQDLGSCAARRVGSTPTIRTITQKRPFGLFCVIGKKLRGGRRARVKKQSGGLFFRATAPPAGGRPPLSAPKQKDS